MCGHEGLASGPKARKRSQACYFKAIAGRGFASRVRWLSRAEPDTVALPVVVALMDAAASQGNLTMAETFFRWKDAGHEMASFNILIKAAGEARLPEAAEYWYFQAKAKNLSANIISYTSFSAHRHRQEKVPLVPLRLDQSISTRWRPLGS